MSGRRAAWPGLVVGRFTQAEPCRARGAIWHICGAGTAGFAPSVGKDHPEAPERQLVSGISWMPARFRETSSRSARLEFGAGVNAELERGRTLPLPRPAGNRSPGVGDRRAARESRMQTPRMADTTTSVQVA